MSVTEVLLAAALMALGGSAAAQLWGQALLASHAVALRQERLHTLDGLLLASEAAARAWAAGADPVEAAEPCPGADALEPRLRALPAAAGATLSLPPSPAGLVHVRWELGGLRRERLLSASALGLCREGGGGV